MSTVHIQFQRGRGGFTAKLPRRLPALRQLCYCVPTLDEGRAPVLMLCGERQLLTWQREVGLLDWRLQRVALMLQVQIKPSCARLRIPEKLLAFAGIQGPARFQLLENGAALLSPGP